MDILFIDDLTVATRVGIHRREQVRPQLVELSLKIGFSAVAAGSSDNIDDTIDYAGLISGVQNELAAQRFKLLERLAEHVASFLLREFASSGVRWVQISAAKRGVLRDVRRVGIVIERGLRD
ncbi:MAG: dihydroneopterin aldolase [Betaproteobacteria bacterium]|nr:dihydroneopterin aldolase [Betaproteobacteria bacterium]